MCCCSSGEGHQEPLKPPCAGLQVQERTLCHIPGLIQETSAATLGLQKSLWERRDGAVPPLCCFPQALCCPTVSPDVQMGDWKWSHLRDVPAFRAAGP